MLPFLFKRIDLKIIDKDKSLINLLKNNIVEYYMNIYEMVQGYLFDNHFFNKLNLS
jgi:hypothetical protein